MTFFQKNQKNSIRYIIYIYIFLLWYYNIIDLLWIIMSNYAHGGEKRITMDIKEIVETNEDLKQFLFIRGFTVTDKADVCAKAFPFYGQWNHNEICGMHFWTHPLTGFHFVKNDKGSAAFILGHAYNPFTMEIDEEPILTRILDAYGTDKFYDRIDEITGVFVVGIISNGKAKYIVDPSGMQSACSGIVNGHFYLSSHPQLIADLCGLEMDKFVKNLVDYKWYHRVMGPYLPADLTPFAELKRVVPNQEYTYLRDSKAVEHTRFYPLKDLAECKTDEEYRATIEEAAGILKNNMELVFRKWEHPWQSLTGGIDSNTTFAAANGNYDKLHTFSYFSAEKESIDCDAAKKISEHFNVPWTLYEIPDNETELDRFAEKAEIIKHNNGYIAKEKGNELRKRVVLQEQCPADVEVKSWVSETIRAYWYKHYGRKSMPELSGKLFRNLYKIFIFDRGLAHEIDELFEEYIDEFEYRKIPSQYPPADMHYNEVTWGSWGGMNISEMKFSFDITFIYNNRRFLDLMFKVPLEKRISDQHHLDVKKYLNEELYDMNIRVVNMKETDFRAFALNTVFTANSILPF